MRNKNKKNKNAYSDDLIQIEKIQYDKTSGIAIATTKPLALKLRSYFSGFKIEGLDISNYSNIEKDNAYFGLSTIFKSLNNRISIVKISKLYDLKENENYLNNKLELFEQEILLLDTNKNSILLEKVDIDENINQENKVLTKIIDENINTINEKIKIFNSYKESLNHFKSTNYQNNYFVFVYGKDQKEVVQNLLDLQSKFERENFGTKLLNKSEIVQTQLDIINHQNKEEINDSLFEPLKDDKNNILQEALTIDDVLAFDKIKFLKDYIEINDNLFVNIQTISKFQLEISYHWLNLLFNTPSSVVMHIDIVDPKEAKNQIHKSDLNLKTNMIDNANVNKLDKIDQDNSLNTLEELAQQVASGEEKLKSFQIFFVNSAYSKDKMKDKMKINSSNANAIDAECNDLVYLQHQSFQNILLKSTDNLNFSQQVPDSTIAGGWPFSTSDFNDKNGFVVGGTNDGDIIILDQFKLDNNRTNYNMMILGSSGNGKSSFTKKLAMYHIAEGNQNIIIDPESEYKGLLKQYGGHFDGSLYCLGGDGKTIFNPLELQQQLKEQDDEEELIKINESIIKEHINWFGSWLKILFDELNTSDIRFINHYVLVLYNKKFKMIKNQKLLSTLESNQYPTISDLIKLIKKEKEKLLNNDFQKENEDNNKWKFNKILEILTHNFIDGKLGDIYNGHSNVSLEDDLVIFDVQSIYNDDAESSIRAALYTIISKINNKLTINYRKPLEERKKIIIIIDEAHLLLDKDNPITVNFLHRLVKRIRKYNGGVVLTTQNIGDFADGVGDKKLTNILGNIQYTFLLKVKSTDIPALDDLYRSLGGLTEYEKKNLTRISKGNSLFNPTPFVRKFIKFHYNELEKNICWSNYINDNEIEEKEIGFDDDLQKEQEKEEVKKKSLWTEIKETFNWKSKKEK